ncbi:MAG: hypothetical protein QM302_09810 [Acidobacteriota bacterium]|nr:hypothetical protein [Acidobacteriota bacterium]
MRHVFAGKLVAQFLDLGERVGALLGVRGQVLDLLGELRDLVILGLHVAVVAATVDGLLTVLVG